ncbi:hypothetical protein RvY_15909 [Ramazzottius varieornatus]|uniref:Chitin-binding type-2 domain-containing protein n=1 Tax=Ramazzottius varieornatus TaxID=947166 RepID=A0A1D1W146_RAMVA|nr:hypothetical protein RvY_15909 [Ramazzottius varieornatus]
MARTETVIFFLLISTFCGSVVRSHELKKRQSVNIQNPPVWQALDLLRGGGEPLNAAQVQQVMASAVPGQSYPTLAYIPQTSFTCSSARQPGFYADPETGCQVFRRCEQNNYMFSYICPNSTLFNQITLVCDYWYNVQCDRSQQFVDYSNPRIYIQGVPLLDDVNNGYGGASGNLIGGGGGNYASGGGGNYAPGSSLGAGQAVTIGGGGTYSGGGGGNQYDTGRVQSQGGRGSNYLQGLSGGSLYSSGSSGSQGGDYSRVQSGAYNTMLGTSSYSAANQQQQQQQLPFGTLVSSSYGPSPQSPYQSPSSSVQGGYAQQNYQQPQPQFQPASGYSSQYSSQQQRAPYSSGVIQQIGPSYRSLSNRLLRLQADASDIFTTKTVTDSTPSSTNVLKSFEQSG